MKYFINGQLVTEQRYKAMERLNNWLYNRSYKSWDDKISALSTTRWFTFEWDGIEPSELERYFESCFHFGWVR